MIKQERQKAKSGKKIPEKLFYKIGEVSRITGVEAYVLRYWETEFPFLKPRKSRSGQRVYIKKDIELINRIKKLLYEEKYTIQGVRKKLDEPHLKVVPVAVTEAASARNDDANVREVINKVKAGLRNILKQLSS